MADKQRDYSIDGIYIGDVIDSSSNFTADNIDTSNYTEITNLVKDSIKNVSDEIALTDFTNAEDDQTDFSVVTEKPVKKYEFSTRDVDFQNLKLAFGGSTSEGVWSAPTDIYTGIEKSLLIISRPVNGVYSVKVFARVQIIGSRIGEYTNETANGLKFSVTILQPIDSSSGNKFTSELNYHKAIAVTNTDVSTAEELGWDYVAGFDSADDYEYSDDDGETWTTCSSNPETELDAGTFLLRVAGYSGIDDEAQWVASDSISSVVTAAT